MNPKRIIIVGTMAFTITISGNLWIDRVSATPLQVFHTKEPNLAAVNSNTAKKGDLLEVLGVSSEEEVYGHLYDGKSLADLAGERGVDVQDVIRLQVAELSEQLDARFAGGNLSFSDYQAQKSELADIITKSVFGEKYN